MRVYNGLSELTSAGGTEIGVSDWLTVTQERIDQFSEATGDHQWIHTDPVRAARGPFGSTIAHGFLTLSLVPFLAQQMYRVDGVSVAVNYGTNKVRFPQPVPVDARLRARAELVESRTVKLGTLVTVRFTIELEGSAKPACVVEALTVYAA
ncbi:MaoC family dehydratase [Nocardioides carbamazepini]|uniref:MaoC family dehydratase n=1 Tax=Nocardioides carbamazepini TaxID=2854259 RepID=UPI00214A34AB|nr:MaoC family dehydratase [Nocardioides carbamazepini]MCR1781279.1 MaoC family dehydratase [Nocardioides carbamazepini]